jgi:hypothetical protein
MTRLIFLRILPCIFWISAFITIPIYASFQIPQWTSGNLCQWDLDIYSRTMHSLEAGHDPYLDGIALQDSVHKNGAIREDSAVSFTYLGTPVTLPLLRLLSHLPGWCVTVYWLLYAAAALAQLWVCMQFGEENERIFLALLAPAAAFFPGLLQSVIILGGNIAYIIYGLVLLAALYGWRRGRWGWFYAAVLIVSCFKPPELTLLAIPILSARRQWLPASVTAAAGVAAFAVQPLLWPAYFHNFLQASDLQFKYNADFGSGPAGVLSMSLYLAHLPYTLVFRTFWTLYVLYAVPACVLLLYLSRRYFAGAISQKQWIPILLCGVILLNPRLIEYDFVPITLPMAMIVFRHIVDSAHRIPQVAIAVTLTVAAGYLNNVSWLESKWVECLILMCVFSLGCWRQLDRSRVTMAVPVPVPVA